jgi:hypothetical protein
MVKDLAAACRADHGSRAPVTDLNSADGDTTDGT